ncbi:MAG: prepilin peptidase [Lachnospiraceae bacterium]|nr:prepilin peptidase [Lachnospiraceae bacterium]
MEWAIAIGFEALCSITDCTRKKVDKRLLFAGGCWGVGMLLGRVSNGTENWYSVLMAMFPGIFLLILSLLTEEKIGYGDGYMILVLGLFLGWESCIAVFCMACLLSAIYAGGGWIFRKFDRNSRIPFAPFLLAASCLVKLVWAGGF